MEIMPSLRWRRGSVPMGLVVGLLLVLSACRPAPSPSPEPTATPTVQPTATYTQTVQPTPTAQPTVPSTATATATATQPAPTSTATATPTTESTATATSMPTPTATPTPTLKPAATSTAVPTRVVQPTATPTQVATGWLGEYYSNADLRGQPTMARTDATVGFDWGNDAPAPGLPVDGFSVRWSRVAAFETGTYEFHAAMDDGMRVYVDDELIVNEWRDEAEQDVTVSRPMSAGTHALRVEYYDRRDRALANLWWEKVRSYADWKGMYWPNQTLLGQPTLLRNDPQISFDWQMGSPGASLSSDHFSARWTRTIDMEEGIYRFQVTADDGVRLWVDDSLIIDAWQDQKSRTLSTDYVIAGAGAHSFQVEYYDNEFQAIVSVSWTRLGASSYPYWKGEYFANPYLSGDPVLVRSERSLDFDWGQNAPAPSLPADGFSARWTREHEFEPGMYRFRILADDGVRFYVDDDRVLNEWHSASGQEYQVDVQLPWKCTLKIEFYEDAGDARIHVSWERIK